MINEKKIQQKRIIFALAYFIPVMIVFVCVAVFFVVRSQYGFGVIQESFDVPEPVMHVPPVEPQKNSGDVIIPRGASEPRQRDGSMTEMMPEPMVDDVLLYEPVPTGGDAWIDAGYGDPRDAQLPGEQQPIDMDDMVWVPPREISPEEIAQLIADDELIVPDVLHEQEFLEIERQITQDLIMRVIWMGVGLLVVSAVFAYWLAGRFIRPLEEALIKQKRFVADASHEMRTPITLMKAELDILKKSEQPSPEVYEGALARVEHSLGYLTTLVRDLFALARLEDGVAIVTSETPLYLSAFTRECVEQFQSHAAHKEIAVTFDDRDDVRAHITQQGYVQIVMVLLDNALKYTPAGGAVCVTLRSRGGRAELLVDDAGPGIAREEREQIFERFYRVDQSRGTQESTGLGLSIVEQIVRAVGAEITVGESTLGGAQFRVTFKEVTV